MTTSTNQQIGYIRSLNGLFVTIRLTSEDRPEPGQVLSLPDKPEVLLLVESSSEDNVYCLNIFGQHAICQHDVVVASQSSLQVPVGKPVLGRVFDATGRVIDGQGSLPRGRHEPLQLATKQHYATQPKTELLETGIKVIDFMAPFVKGRRIGIIGGAGVGKTVLTTEMMHNVADKKAALSFFVGIGERIREGHELYHTLKDRGLADTTAMFLGQMSENAALRSLVGPAAATAARSFANDGQNVLFFVDNIYRFVQARNELSAMRGTTPSEGGYQASLFSDLHRFEDSLHATQNGSITSIQSIFIPADDLSDPAVVEISQQLDSTIVLSREVFERGIFPAVDLLNTSSSLISPEILGERHFNLVGRVKAIMRKYYSLRTIIAIVGESELSPDDRLDYERAQELTQFFSQHMFVTEDLSGKKGEYFTREQTLKGVEAILNAGSSSAQSAQPAQTQAEAQAVQPT